jgi:hypothetical protein
MIAILLALQAAAAQEPRVVEKLRVFPENAPVTLTVSGGGPAPLSLVRRGPSGDRALGDRKPDAGKLDLGILPRGYYELQSPGNPPLAFVVTFDPASRPKADPDRARIAADGAIAWLVKPEDYEAVSRAMALSGVSWVRDRLSWGEVQPARGEFRKGRYEKAARAQRAAGLSVVTVFHDTAAWARPGREGKTFPERLDDAYAFGKSLAEQFKGLIQAYEVWNEADIDVFAVETADRYAPFLKAASLGIRAGDPGAIVLMNSFAHQAQGFGEVLFENEIGAYAEAYNHHLYQPPDRHPGVAAWHYRIAERYGIAALPRWVTEAGVALPDAGGRLKEADRWKQADFVAKSYARSLSAGIDRHFYFIFPYYKEGAVDFGLMDRDLAPAPGVAAFATMSYALGRADFLGEGIAGIEDVTAILFDAGPWRTAVLWARDAREIAVKTADPGVRALNLTGEDHPAPAGRVALGPSPVYVLAKDLSPAAPRVRPKPAPLPPPPALKEIVLRINLPREAASFKKQLYVMAPGAAHKAEVEVWNFGPAPFRGTVRLACGAPFRVEPAEAPVEVPAMGSARAAAALHAPAEGDSVPALVEARAVSGDRRSPAARLRVALDARRANYPAVEPFPLAPKDWAPGISGGGDLKLSTGEGGALRMEASFKGEGDRWTYPALAFNPPRDLSRFEALRLRLRIVQPAEGLVVRMQLIEPGGVNYLTEDGLKPKPGESVEWVVPFREFGHGGFSSPDPNGKLDLDRIERLLVGFNQKGDRAAVELLALEAVGSKR